MNRAERRRQGKEKDKVYYLKQSEINAIKEEAVKEAVGKAFALMYYIPTMVLRDKWGFGKERLGRFADQVTDMYESYDLGITKDAKLPGLDGDIENEVVMYCVLILGLSEEETAEVVSELRTLVSLDKYND